MVATIICECSNCHGLLMAAINHKTRACPHCGTRVEMRKSKRLATAKNAFEASEILRKLKAERQVNVRKPNLK